MVQPSQPDTDSSTQLDSVTHYHGSDTHPCSDHECPYYIDNVERIVNNHAKLLKALEKIARREGAYNRDPRIHAENTIDNMERIARDAIEEAKS